MSHAPWSERINDLVSGELPDDQRRELEEHLATCEECQAELDAVQAIRGATRKLADAVSLPPGFEEETRNRLEPRPRASSAPRMWLAVAAAFLLAVWALVSLRTPPPPDLTRAALESFRLHQAGELPLAITTTDEAVLEGFFARQLDFDARVIDLRMMEFGLAGGRVHELLGRPSALYAYRGPDGRVVVCQMLPGTLEELPRPDEVHEEREFTFHVYERDGLTAVFWLEGEILCVLASDMPAPELLALAREKAMA